MAATYLGVIAEDLSDVDVVHVIARKIARKSFAIRHFVGHGCGKIKGKCNAWARDLRLRGCTLLVVIHDLDIAGLATLRTDLSTALHPSPIANHVIVIPVREIEAWLLADHRAIARAIRAKRPVNPIANPEALTRPKEHLRDLIARVTERRTVYVNTVHNKRIAEELAVANLIRCSSFRPFRQFIHTYL